MMATPLQVGGAVIGKGPNALPAQDKILGLRRALLRVAEAVVIVYVILDSIVTPVFRPVGATSSHPPPPGDRKAFATLCDPRSFGVRSSCGRPAGRGAPRPTSLIFVPNMASFTACRRWTNLISRPRIARYLLRVSQKRKNGRWCGDDSYFAANRRFKLNLDGRVVRSTRSQVIRLLPSHSCLDSCFARTHRSNDGK